MSDPATNQEWKDFLRSRGELAVAWERYHLDGCQCVQCREIRAAFEEWRKKQKGAK